MGFLESSGRSATAAPLGGELVALREVSRRRAFGRRSRMVLDRVSFDLLPGELVGVRGPRRSGKTTLLRIVAGIEVPDAGHVSWRGAPVTASRRARRASWVREVGFVPQGSAWRAAPGKPMLHHIAVPLVIRGMSVPKALAAARDAAAAVGAEALVGALPHELPPDALTRLALARALAPGPRLLVVDDPCAAATVAEQRAVHALLLSVAADHPEMGMLVASGELSMLHGTSRVLRLDGDGGLCAPDRPSGSVIVFPAVETRTT